MFIKHFKGQPNDHIIRFHNGKVVQHGSGLEFWYMPYNTSIAAVPTVSQDSLFIFHEATANFQQVAVQGLLSFRIDDPVKVSERFDFTIDPTNGRYLKQDIEKLAQRVVNAMQDHARKEINTLPLERALIEIQELSDAVFHALKNESFFEKTGIEIEMLHFSSVEATPEMKEALEASYRESLKRDADKAVYERRAAAGEEEFKIKQNEIRGDIALEEQRSTLVDIQAENDLKLAEAEAKAEQMRLDPYAQMAPQALIGLALKDFAGNANNIGNLSITPDMLGQLSAWMHARPVTGGSIENAETV